MASKSIFSPSPRSSPDRTRKMLRGPKPGMRPDTTHFELSASTAHPNLSPAPEDSQETRVPKPDKLDAQTQRTFHQRLRLCCVIATMPLAFFFLCSLTDFIELFGYRIVGPVGASVCGAVVLALAAIAAFMFRKKTIPERALRVLEIAVFGQLGLFFAYWQFTVQTGMSDDFYRANDRRDLVRDSGARPDVSKVEEPPKVEEPLVEPMKEDPLPVRTKEAPLARGVERAVERTEAERHVNGIYDSLRVLAVTLISHFNWLLLIVFHAVLVPNTLARGIGVTLAMVLTPLGIDAVVVAIHTPAQENAIALFAIALTMLIAASGLAIFGTAKIAELQRQVESAREAMRELGQYRLRRKLGSGGMGEVFLAEHRLLKRACALKRIHAKYLNNPEQLRRFEREVQATAQLRHPNTVEIYDYGVADDGTFFYVMEYLPGMSLEELVGRFGPIPAERVIHLLRQVCGALREAHALGLVHRDIKPSNIVVFPAGSPHDQVKLVDFGLVHSLAEVDKPEEKITRDGLIVGTPEYMSPEQATGGVLDGRSDLFSLGSVAYYLVTGREAFHRDNPVKTLMAVVSDTPAPMAEFNPFAPADLLHAIAKSLEKEPNARFASAADMEHALQACAAADLWTEEKSNEWWASHPTAAPNEGTDIDSLPLRESAG